MMRCHVKIHGRNILHKLKNSTTYIALSVGSRASIHGIDTEYLENVVGKLNSLEDKPNDAFLLIAWELQQFNFDQFIVPLNTSKEDPINKCNVLTEEELLNAFITLESDSILSKIPEDKQIDTDLAAELFAKMFEPIAKKTGDRLAEALVPIWKKLETKKAQDEVMHVGVVSLGDVIKKHSVVKDWDNNKEEYNKYQRTLSTIEKEYNTQEVERKEFDVTIEDVFKKRKFVEAGEKLKEFLRVPEHRALFKNKAMLIFFDAILTYLDFEKIGKKEIRMYLFTELAQMRSEPSKTFILYANDPPESLRAYYKRHKIPLVKANMYAKQIKQQNEQEQSQPVKETAGVKTNKQGATFFSPYAVVSMHKEKKDVPEKTSEVLPKEEPTTLTGVLLSKDSEKSQSITGYSQIESHHKQNSFLDNKQQDDFQLESLEQKRAEAKPVISSSSTRARHDLPSLNIPSAFYRQPLPSATARGVGSMKRQLLMLVLMLEDIPDASVAEQSLNFAAGKLENILEQVKLLSSNMSHTSQPNDIAYSSPKISVMT